MSTTEQNETPAEPIDPELESIVRYANANPNSLPPQFGGDPEKFVKSWKDQRAEITRLQQAAKSKPASETPKTDEAAPPPAAEPTTLQIPTNTPPPASELWVSAGKEINETGNISPATREALTKNFGVPNEIVDGYITGIQHRQKAAAQAAADVIGGSEKLNAVLQWASTALPDAERATINEALKSPGWQTIILGLKARYDASNPTKDEPTRPTGSSRPAPVSEPFSSSAEITAAIRDPRYNRDVAYTRTVQERIYKTSQNKA